MPLPEFENLLRRATQFESPSEIPRLLAAKYRCRWESGDLVGSANLTIRHSAGEPGFLKLDPLSLAIRGARWSDDRPAFIGEFGARANGSKCDLLVDRSGDQLLNLGWSARGIREPDATRFDLRFPACAIAQIELELPSDLEPIVSREEVLLTGPFTDTASDRNTWRIGIAGAERLDLTVASSPSKGAPGPLVLSSQRTRQEIDLAHVASDFIFDLKVLRGNIHLLEIDCDRDFQPVSVTARNLDRWDVRTGTSNRIVINWREPFTGGTVTIRGFSPTVRSGVWISPGALAVGAISRGETLSIQPAMDVRLVDFQIGSFLAAESVPNRTAPITLRCGTIRRDDSRPSARIAQTASVFHAQERIWWRLDANSASITAQLTVEVLDGQIDESLWRLPDGWDIERVEFPHVDGPGSWRIENRTLVVQWPRPCLAGHSVSAKVQLSEKREEQHGVSCDLNAPDLISIGAAESIGWVAVNAPPGWSVTSDTASAAVPRDDRTSPWAGREPNLVLPLRPGGVPTIVQLRPRNGNVRSEGTCRVVLSADRVRVIYRLMIAPRDGVLESAVIHGPLARHRQSGWRVVGGGAQLRTIEALGAECSLTAAIGGSATWSAALNAAMIGHWQFVTFSPPISHAVELEVRDEQPLHSGVAELVPLYQVFGSDDTRWHVTVDRRGAPDWNCRLAGDNPYWIGGDAEGRESFWTTARERSLRITHSADSGRTFIDDAHLIVDATQHGRLSYRLTLGVWQWRQRNFPIRLPPNAQSIAVLIDGVRVSFNSSHQVDGEILLDVPVTIANNFRMDVCYILPSDVGQLYVRHNSDLARVPIDLPPFQVQWILPPDWEPAQRDHWLEELAPDGQSPADDTGRRWLARETGGEAIDIIRPSAFRLLAWAGAIAALVLSALADARVAGRVAVAVGLLLALAAIWLPEPWQQVVGPPLLACAILVVRARFAHALATSAIRTSILRVAPVAGLIGGICLSGGGNAAAPPPVVIYLLPDASGRAAHTSVLVPPQLPDLLRSAARRAGGFGRAVPIAAHYDARVDGAAVQITAKFQVYSSQDEPAKVVLPLPGTVLREATVDGAPAFPTSAGDQTTISVTGRGLHTLELKLAADCPVGDSREFHLTIPELPSTHLSFRAPAGAKHLRTLLWRGAQHVSLEAGGPTLDADLGPVGALALCWNREPRTEPAGIRVKETYLWDLQELAARLVASVQFNVLGGAKSLSVDIPPELEIASVTARPLDASLAASPPPWLLGWTISTDLRQRRLTLEFSAPIAGAWQVALECIPRAPFAPTFALKFPTASGTPEAPAACAYRADGLDVAVTGTTGFSPIPVDEFLATYWSASRLEVDLRAPTHAYLRSALETAPVIRMRAGQSRAPAVKMPHSDAPQSRSTQVKSRDDRERPKPSAIKDRSLSGPVIRMPSIDVTSTEPNPKQRVHRLTSTLNASGPTDLTLRWPEPVEIAAIAFDSDVLMVLREKTTEVTIPIDERHRYGTLRCVWLSKSGTAIERSSIPRFESGGHPLAPESVTRSIVIPPGRKLVANPKAQLAPTSARTASVHPRLPFDGVLNDGLAKTWAIAGDSSNMSLEWETEPSLWPGRMIRTASMVALVVLVVLIRKLVGYSPLPEMLASLALAGWIATGAWLWFVPLAFAVVVRATSFISSWRFGPQSTS
jgi:hypothetical protein